MSYDLAVKVENLSKCFHIYSSPKDRLKQFFFPRLHKLLGRNPTKFYKEFWALQHIDLEVKKGETVGIIGHNGSGKSTLLQIICGTLLPSEGFIQTNGRIAALLELGSGFNPEFTGKENVYLNGAILGLQKKEIDHRFDEIASFADIGDFIHQPVKSYSSGMYVRLAFAVQAMVDPDILIVDEALAVGDEKFQRKCFARIEALKAKGTAIIFVSHSSSQIMELCDKTLLLDHGKRLMFSSSEEVIKCYQKLIYAPDSQRDKITNELLIKNKTPEILNNDDNVHNNIIDLINEKTSNDTQNTLDIDDFDSGLTPETTIIYQEQGAKIEHIQILNQQNTPVNIISPRKNYKIRVSGSITTANKDVCFGIHIKTISGIEITGQRFPQEGKFIHIENANQYFDITFNFYMCLLPGIYFVGGGIWSKEEPTCAHRIVDALMFRVNPYKALTSFGYVDLQDTPPALVLRDK